ncbi:TPA: heavy metal translocating P-type ATPase [Legionella pneumophila]|uniref:P-type Zn(2+) transporter n=1 Tax=Legionella pneumophila TaxID=446 RepID=A0AAP3MEB8_LEGPN|nr:heavy metal translocating P-type ATPase [Legionella pneumophila]ABQ55778.1 cadmium translocating P-type ATPase CadA [Legionella pneumophila str. Corby]MCZ4692405.1 heavy metal translocating P-type ATPase [Legionella pneumophila]MCZ4710714.1 heavy metal translocating P-type ATPase [Legionella pneumophila]MCZ4720407.1 heavy metal translocating P-type ATPase [Legionella pneumophila]WBA06689.1 cadmium translocating P-type ATPase CadA [Legionella pneumophila]
MTVPLNETKFFVAGLDCPAEEQLIRKQLQDIPEVEQLDFNFIAEEVTIHHRLASSEELQKRIEALGMSVRTLESTLPIPQRKQLSLDFSWKIIGLAGFLALFSELAAYFLATEQSIWTILPALLAIGLSGPSTFKKGWLALGTKTMNINSLMFIAIAGAVLIGEWPEAAMVTVLFALAERIERYSLDKARLAIRSLMQIAPEVASVKQDDGQWQTLAIEKVVPGAIFRVKPGERIPLDGVVISGQSTVNQAPITGESMPITKKVGDLVFAGTLNEHGAFEVQVSKVSGDTLLAKIGKAIEQAQADRAPTQRFVDQFSKYYTPIMVLMAFFVALIPPLAFGYPFYDSLYKSLTLLVIACPCALVISTPVTVVSGLAAAAKQGLLIKGGSYLEVGHRLRLIALDKTGTLTEGKPVVTDFIAWDENRTKESLLLLAASLDSHSEHPVANALVQYWQQEQPQNALLEIEQFSALPGRGVKGLVGQELYFVGNHQLAEDNQVCNHFVEQELKRLEEEGKTTVILSNATTVLAIFAVADTLRVTSQQAIAQLHERGIKTAMLTGDNAVTAQAIAKKVGIDEVNANILPAEKLQAINGLLDYYNSVGMVGDGINDAPALAKATVSFAMGKGTDTALETADVALMNDNLARLPFYIDLSRKTARTLYQNISLSIAIKGIFFILALVGYATLWMAVFADMGASLIVVANGLRLLYMSPDD